MRRRWESFGIGDLFLGSDWGGTPPQGSLGRVGKVLIVRTVGAVRECFLSVSQGKEPATLIKHSCWPGQPRISTFQ